MRSDAPETARRWIYEGRADLPLPGAGDTAGRWRELRSMARQEVAAARLVEAHADAAAICSELGLPMAPDRTSLWGVWAAEPPAPVLEAVPEDGGWTLHGTKAWCSAAGEASHALVTARHEGRPRLYAVDLSHPAVTVPDVEWAAAGMSQTLTGEVRFHGAPAWPAGPHSAYLERTGFWHGGVGVANCWWGGAQGLIDILRQRLQAREEPHGMAHLGACLAWDATITAAMDAAGQQVDSAPDDHAAAKLRAYSLRSAVEHACSEVLRRFGRALGAEPYARDAAAAGRIQDLEVYIRQSHAERDDAELARLAISRVTP